ncbi:MAG: sulfite exporter TauE/SafE family protein [Planctomycetota bacterium]
MSPTTALLGTAVWIGFIHTLFGPDHYVPFVAMARAGQWTRRKTLAITLLCGLGHVAGSVALGLIGIALGALLLKLEWIETVRAEVAAWLLLAFGLLYFIYGVVRAIRHVPHSHAVAKQAGEADSLTPWILFTIFLFGPCEPLIPILMYPAAHANALVVVLVTLAFALATLTTMTAAVLLLYAGVGVISWQQFHRFSHAAAGLAIALCGVAVKFGL